jgi:hypothetical protein
MRVGKLAESLRVRLTREPSLSAVLVRLPAAEFAGSWTSPALPGSSTDGATSAACIAHVVACAAEPDYDSTEPKALALDLGS